MNRGNPKRALFIPMALTVSNWIALPMKKQTFISK
jgi:hypothetical protein